jgi:hypothetical protein
MSYFQSADDYKMVSEISGNKSTMSDDYSHQDTVAGGIAGSSCVQNQDCGDMLYCSNGICTQNPPPAPVVEPFRLNKNTGKFEPFRLNKNTGKFEPFRPRH